MLQELSNEIDDEDKLQAECEEMKLLIAKLEAEKLEQTQTIANLYEQVIKSLH